ncbi:MAG: DUF4128 domain-containing protein [Laribacter sp.]|nr:DUF4128 domain-containing protein [Laribacter sp.]MBP9607854.1 DUF4128 domain-containing protein [Laribacter sp.]
MNQTAIRAALEQRLKTWADAHAPPLKIAWQNVEFTPPTGPHLRAFLLPGETLDPTIGGGHQRRIGLFQVSVYAPEGIGPSLGDELADDIVSLFPRGLSICGVQIDSTPSIAGPRPEPGWSVTPVSIRYRVDIFA